MNSKLTKAFSLGSLKDTSAVLVSCAVNQMLKVKVNCINDHSKAEGMKGPISRKETGKDSM